ncbi:hypothetical protein PRZ48_007367 [Zasmidium cellare]|uniref:Uncharacterized protein n=1 Tax=Zasmidium cellare TaxID=395010 RepID=A0ABR0EK04_ZASCE|nr:hypothetical protein PRZ48_007367 [Zasmidium cellare]
MSNHTQPLYGIEARSDWLHHIINTLHAVARSRLLEAERRRFHESPSTPADQRAFQAHEYGEGAQVGNCIREAIGSLRDILAIGGDYVHRTHGFANIPLPEGGEGRRYVPVLTVGDQREILGMVTEVPRPEETARLGLPVFRGRENLEVVANDELAHLVNVRRQRRRNSRTPAEPRRRSPVPTPSETQAANTDNVKDEDITKDEDVDLIWAHIRHLVQHRDDEHLTAQEREHRAIARSAEMTLMQLNERVEATGEETFRDTEKVNEIAKELFESYPFEFRVELGKFFDEVGREVRGKGKGKREVKEEEHALSEVEAGPSTGRGTIKREPDSPGPQPASVEDAREETPDPASVPLPDSDSAYGSASSTVSERQARR